MHENDGYLDNEDDIQQMLKRVNQLENSCLTSRQHGISSKDFAVKEKNDFISKDYSGVFQHSQPDMIGDQRMARWEPSQSKKEQACSKVSDNDYVQRREDYKALRSKSRSRSPISQTNNEDNKAEAIMQTQMISAGQRSLATAQATIDNRDESYISQANRDQKSIRHYEKSKRTPKGANGQPDILVDFHREKNQFNAKLKDLKDKLATLSLSPQRHAETEARDPAYIHRDDKYDAMRNNTGRVGHPTQPRVSTIHSPHGVDEQTMPSNRDAAGYDEEYQSNFARRQQNRDQTSYHGSRRGRNGTNRPSQRSNSPMDSGTPMRCLPTGDSGQAPEEYGY